MFGAKKREKEKKQEQSTADKEFYKSLMKSSFDELAVKLTGDVQQTITKWNAFMNKWDKVWSDENKDAEKEWREWLDWKQDTNSKLEELDKEIVDLKQEIVLVELQKKHVQTDFSQMSFAQINERLNRLTHVVKWTLDKIEQQDKVMIKMLERMQLPTSASVKETSK